MHCSCFLLLPALSSFFCFFNHPAPTEIYTLSLHDALPICVFADATPRFLEMLDRFVTTMPSNIDEYEALLTNNPIWRRDRKSTRLNSSHPSISYAVFCLKKKKNKSQTLHHTNTQYRHISIS